jgi:CDP-glycerol glycerophosphotransferase
MTALRDGLRWLGSLILNILLWPVRRCIPVRPSLVLFTSGMRDSYQLDPKALFEQLAGDPDFTCYWVTGHPAVRDLLRKRGLPVIGSRSLIFVRLAIRAGWMFATHNNLAPVFLRNPATRLVQTWHGIPLKALGRREQRHTWRTRARDAKLKNCSHWLASSDFSAQLYQDAFGVAPDRMLIQGHPRNDVFFRSGGSPNRSLEILLRGRPRPPAERLLLYCPTYRDRTTRPFFPFPDFDHGALEQKLEAWNARLIMRQHYFDPGPDLRDWTDCPRVMFAPPTQVEVDVQELMAAADLLITDYSSVYLDFLLTGRPIVFLNPDLETYRRERGFMFDYDRYTPGPKAATFAEFIQAMDQSLGGPDRWREERARAAAVFHRFADGESTERVIGWLKKQAGAGGYAVR